MGKTNCIEATVNLVYQTTTIRVLSRMSSGVEDEAVMSHDCRLANKGGQLPTLAPAPLTHRHTWARQPHHLFQDALLQGCLSCGSGNPRPLRDEPNVDSCKRAHQVYSINGGSIAPNLPSIARRATDQTIFNQFKSTLLSVQKSPIFPTHVVKLSQQIRWILPITFSDRECIRLKGKSTLTGNQSGHVQKWMASKFRILFGIN